MPLCIEENLSRRGDNIQLWGLLVPLAFNSKLHFCNTAFNFILNIYLFVTERELLSCHVMNNLLHPVIVSHSPRFTFMFNRENN